MNTLVGTTIAGYQILRRFGNGGMGEVYLAKETRLCRLVALKVLLFASSPPFQASTEEIIDELNKILNKTTKITSPIHEDLPELIRQISGEQKTKFAGEVKPHLQIDTALKLKEVYLHKDIGHASAQSAEVLLKLSRFPQGYPHLIVLLQVKLLQQNTIKC
jgi:hypothetical protein